MNDGSKTNAGVATDSAQPAGSTCRWRYDEIDCFYHTECGDGFCLIDDGLKENRFNFCPFCGGEIKQVHFDRSNETAHPHR